MADYPLASFGAMIESPKDYEHAFHNCLFIRFFFSKEEAADLITSINVNYEHALTQHTSRIYNEDDNKQD